MSSLVDNQVDLKSVPSSSTTGVVISKKASVIATNRLGEKPKTDPLRYLYHIPIPRGLNSPLQLDVIRLTAQYAAANGKSFLQAVTVREANNPLFEFLLPTSRYFKFFIQVSEVYSRIVNPEIPLNMGQEDDDGENDDDQNDENESDEKKKDHKKVKTVIDQLKMLANESNKSELLNLMYRKAEWETIQEEERKRKAMDEESERSALNAIDWHDFVVVETIDFDEGSFAEEEEAGGTTRMEAEYEVKEYYGAAEMPVEAEDVEMDIDNDVEMDTTEDDDYAVRPMVSSHAEYAPSVRSRLLLDDDEEIEKRIRKNVERPSTTVGASTGFDASKFFRDPTTGELIPIEQAESHMRIKTLNPMWKEQKSREIEKFKTTNIASDAEISNQLSSMVKRRTQGADQASKEDTGPKPVRWDGHKTSAALVSAQNAALGITIPDPQAPLPNMPIYGPSIPQPQHAQPTTHVLPPPPFMGPVPPTGYMPHMPPTGFIPHPSMLPPTSMIPPQEGPSLRPPPPTQTGPRPEMQLPAPKRPKLEENK